MKTEMVNKLFKEFNKCNRHNNTDADYPYGYGDPNTIQPNVQNEVEHEEDIFEIELGPAKYTSVALDEIDENYLSPVYNENFPSYIYQIVNKLESIINEIKSICNEIDELIDISFKYTLTSKSVQDYIQSEKYGSYIFEIYFQTTDVLNKLKNKYQDEIKNGYLEQKHQELELDWTLPEAKAIQHRFVLLHELNIIQYLKENVFDSINESDQVKLLLMILGLPKDNFSTIRGCLRNYLDKESKYYPLTSKALKQVHSDLLELGINNKKNNFPHISRKK